MQNVNYQTTSVSFFSLEVQMHLKLFEKEKIIAQLYDLFKTELFNYYNMKFEIIDIQIAFPKKVLSLSLKANEKLKKVISFF